MQITIGHDSVGHVSDLDGGAFEIKPLDRCDSCLQHGWESAPSSPTDSRSIPLDNPNPLLQELSEASRQQIRWDSVMCKTLGLHEGYARISVLLIMWDDTDWLVEVKREIEELSTVFREGFGFEVKILKLKAACSCKFPCLCSVQKRLDRAVTGFFEKYGSREDENNLVILYHTGHGTFDTNSNHLELSGREDVEGQPEPPKVIWNHTEASFVGAAKCDVLTIMDSCFAGGVTAAVQGTGGHTWEYLGASLADDTTPAPGPNSFTSALIDALRRLLDDCAGASFTTMDLQNALIEEQKKRASREDPPRHVKNGVLLTRSKENKRRIELRPLKADMPYFTNKKVHSYLTLRIELLQDELTNEEFDDLAKRVSRAVRKAKTKTRRVDYLGIQPRSKMLLSKTVNRLRTISGAFGVRSMLQVASDKAIVEAQPAKPGIFVVLGRVSPRQHAHKLIILLYRPWSLIVVGGLMMLAFARLFMSQGLLEAIHYLPASWPILPR